MNEWSALVEDLEEDLGGALCIVANHWVQPHRSYDFDRMASRMIVDALYDLARSEHGAERARLIVFGAGRGGHPGFVQALTRAARAHWDELVVCVPYFSTGIYSLLALEADAVILHPYGALGAVDDGGVEPLLDTPDPSANDRWGALSRSMAARAVEEVSKCTPEDFVRARLGSELGHCSDELANLGLDVLETKRSSLELMWRLYESIETELGLRSSLVPRYTESDLADEVEFEMAVGLAAALIQTRVSSSRYVMDTGRPDPDTGHYAGDWETDSTRV